MYIAIRAEKASYIFLSKKKIMAIKIIEDEECEIQIWISIPQSGKYISISDIILHFNHVESQRFKQVAVFCYNL